MDRLAYRVLAGPEARPALALRRLGPDSERQTPGPELQRLAAQAGACCAVLGAL
jgi:hypothetical protein